MCETIKIGMCTGSGSGTGTGTGTGGGEETTTTTVEIPQTTAVTTTTEIPTATEEISTTTEAIAAIVEVATTAQIPTITEATDTTTNVTTTTGTPTVTEEATDTTTGKPTATEEATETTTETPTVTDRTTEPIGTWANSTLPTTSLSSGGGNVFVSVSGGNGVGGGIDTTRGPGNTKTTTVSLSAGGTAATASQSHTTELTNSPTQSQNATPQGGSVWFEEHYGKTIVETYLVSSVARPVALRTTGNLESCQQTCLDTEMNSFQCWAVTIPDPSSEQCVLYYIDAPSKLRAPSVMVSLTGSVIFLKLQDSAPTLGTPCSCKLDINWDPPANASTEYMLELLEALLQLKAKLSIKKNETQKYQRTLISAEDKRTSAVGIGSMGVALLVMIAAFVLVADIDHFVSLFNFLKRSCQRKSDTAQS
ncbi:cell wall protein SED1-like [Pecten maximus]|uniref:cell wall protein SED1-like n=1 Tax=Pecten maximus TaxID=6579 RepID=UPI0014591B26|nr:cell wall protein SED1-like [Pecten maximus]